MLKKTHRLRLFLLGLGSIMVFGVIQARLIHLQLHQHEHYVAKAKGQQHKGVTLPPRRGQMLDREGVPLATSYLTDTIILDARALRRHTDRKKLSAAPPELVNALATATGRPAEKIAGYAEKGHGHWILHRKAPTEVRQAVELVESRYNLPRGVIVKKKNCKREYPMGPLAAHLLGFTKIDDEGNDNIGLAGLELRYDKWLKGHYQSEKIPASAGLRRRGLGPLSESVIDGTFGNNLRLTLDHQIQMYADKALAEGVAEAEAKAGVAVVMDVETGAILAMSNMPGFDPNDFGRTTSDQRRNRAITDQIQIGSVMKIMTTSVLLDAGLMHVDEVIDCMASGYARIDGRAFIDTHPLGEVPFREAFAESSNIGMATLATRMEPEIFYDGLNRFGVGLATGIELPGEVGGLLRPVSRWTRPSRTSIAIGYECSLTALQVVSAVAAIGNDGWRMQPYLVDSVESADGTVVRKTEPRRVRQVASAATCATVRGLMEEVVAHGTGMKASVPGYRIGGKTGTTRKTLGDDTERRYIASFAGLVPADRPRVAIYVYVDEPQSSRYGGTVAAPIFRRIAEGVIHRLGIAPNDREAFQVAQAERDLEVLPRGGSDEPLRMVPVLKPRQAPADGSEQATGPAMPDCRGMTMLEAWDRLAVAGIDSQMLGSGVVVRQDPGPGAATSSGVPAVLIFAHPSVAMENAGSELSGRAE